MKLLHIITAILCIGFASQAIAETQDIDKELADLTEKLATPITERQKTKIAVLDFMNLEGNPKGELGKYIAEQLTVNFVTTKRSFSVLDRANLKKILAEHKLTSQGLIDPENAKKLGQFAGVDALVLGTIIPKGTNSVGLTAKIITTDTAEIIGAARAEFKSDDVVRQLTDAPVAATGESQPESITSSPVRKLFGDLQAKVESLKLLPLDQYPGGANLSLIITNTSETKTYGVGLLSSVVPYTLNLFTNSRGDQFSSSDVSGIEVGYRLDGDDGKSLSDIPPKSSITISAKCTVNWNGKPGDYRPYRIQTTVLFGEEKQGRYPDLRKYNLVLDVK